MKKACILTGVALMATTFIAGAQARGSFQGIPLDGSYFTVEDFDLDPSTNPKSVKIQRQYDDFLHPGYSIDTQYVTFDDQGRVVEFLFDRHIYNPLKVDYTYGDNGKLSKIHVQQQAVTAVEDNPTPLMDIDYVYTWSGNGVSDIAETITVDRGLNYKGSPVHLKVTSVNGKPTKATATRINFEFDGNGKKTSGRSWQLDGYDNDWPYGLGYDKVDDIFRMVNLTHKLPLHWSNMDDDPDLVYGAPFNINFSGAQVEKDANGNWIKATLPGDDYPDIFIREIEY